MAVEIERKFLVDKARWQAFRESQSLVGEAFRQGYLAEGDSTVRVRIKGNSGWLTIKGKTRGLSRLEFEYEIPLADAQQMLEELSAKPLIEKERFLYTDDNGHTWEVDEFAGDNTGLIVAEIELPSEQAAYRAPDWLGEEVSLDARYFNVNLAKVPYTQWG